MKKIFLFMSMLIILTGCTQKAAAPGPAAAAQPAGTIPAAVKPASVQSVDIIPPTEPMPVKLTDEKFYSDDSYANWIDRENTAKNMQMLDYGPLDSCPYNYGRGMASVDSIEYRNIYYKGQMYFISGNSVGKSLPGGNGWETVKVFDQTRLWGNINYKNYYYNIGDDTYRNRLVEFTIAGDTIFFIMTRLSTKTNDLNSKILYSMDLDGKNQRMIQKGVLGIRFCTGGKLYYDVAIKGNRESILGDEGDEVGFAYRYNIIEYDIKSGKSVIFLKNSLKRDYDSIDIYAFYTDFIYWAQDESDENYEHLIVHRNNLSNWQEIKYYWPNNIYEYFSGSVRYYQWILNIDYDGVLYAFDLSSGKRTDLFKLPAAEDGYSLIETMSGMIVKCNKPEQGEITNNFNYVYRLNFDDTKKAFMLEPYDPRKP